LEVPTDSRNLSHLTGSTARTLLKIRSEVLTAWEKEARASIKKARELEQPILYDALPSFLDNLMEALAGNHPRELATSQSSVATEHGGERARLTRYGPDQILREYQILRDIIFDRLSAKGPIPAKDGAVISKSFDQAIQESMSAYFLVHSRIREQFVASLSHDLRSPLSAAKMSAELILSVSSAIKDPEVRQDIAGLAQRVVATTKRADRMIQDLLDATVVQIGEKLPLRIIECDILTVVRDVIVELPLQDQKRIRIDGGAPRGFWDCDGLRRAVENLINNAIKYGASGTPITIRLATYEERMTIAVHNEGKAIPIEEQETLFQPFRRSQAAKASGTKGWGIGLALVRGVAEGHGGSVTVDSAPDRGTTLIIDIPVDARPYQNAPTTE
jgi:signal transduction histidine kinase